MQLEASNTVIPDIEEVVKLYFKTQQSSLCKLLLEQNHYVSLDPEFVINIEDANNESLNNIISSNRLGETQVAPEILVWVSENICSFGKRKHTDQKLLVIRVISTYFTFIIYKTEIPCRVFEGT
ncbi:19534_t:CDS:2 [Rhizophagus irregularis]|nr:19534_t:CDS:2 [Rhizophagus irregularis]